MPWNKGKLTGAKPPLLRAVGQIGRIEIELLER
jgi:hypothetical protein